MVAKKKLVLVVDDDVRVLRMMRQILELEELQVMLAHNGEEALEVFETSRPDLVLLDIMMPGMDGLTVCERIREFSSVPIIMVTARSGNEEIIEGLDTGADDYIVKPFSASELAARVRAILRRSHTAENSAIFHLHDLKIDYSARQVTIGRKEIKLTSIEYKLLSYLSQNAGQIITPEQLIDNVWGNESMGRLHLVQVNVGRLRKKLGDDARSPKYIITRPGIGYSIPRPDSRN